MTNIPSMTFVTVVFLAAFCMEGIGSYVSIIGLGELFARDIVILAMALILDIAKIVTVSFLYQYWVALKREMKYYMMFAVIVLMTITSVGAFGYLSAAFQKAMQPNLEVILKVDSYKREKEQLMFERESLLERKSKIDQQIAQLPPESIRGRRTLIQSFKPETDQILSRTGEITKRVDQLTGDIMKAENENIEKSVHAGPIIYISKAFNISIEDASKWIILVIISVFDPLAIVLIIAGNFLIVQRKNATHYAKETIQTIVKVQEPIQEPIQEKVQEKVQEVEQPIDKEISNIVNSVYNSHDTGEKESDLEIDTSVLSESIKKYVPVLPVEKIYRSSLEDITVSLPKALIRDGVTTASKKRHLYES